MKKIYTLAFLIFIAATVFANGVNESKETGKPGQSMVLSGKVTDMESGEALTGVKIEIPGLNIWAYTDFDGTYSVVLPEKGTYKVNYQLITYHKVIEQKIDAKSNDIVELDIKLKRL